MVGPAMLGIGHAGALFIASLATLTKLLPADSASLPLAASRPPQLPVGSDTRNRPSGIDVMPMGSFRMPGAPPLGAVQTPRSLKCLRAGRVTVDALEPTCRFALELVLCSVRFEAL